jgi:hypothetical protein
MKKKILVSLLAAMLLVCVFTVGVIALNETEPPEFRIAKAQLELNADLRLRFKVSGAPDGAEVKLLVWEGTADGVDYTKADKTTEGFTEITDYTENEDLLVFVYDGIKASEMGKTMYIRAYYETEGEAVYTETKRYSMAEYLYNTYNNEITTEKEKDVIEALMAYGDAAQELKNEGAPLPKISDGVVKISVTGGKFADGFAEGKFLSGEKLSVVEDDDESTDTKLTAEISNNFCWADAEGYYGYANTVEYSDGMFVDNVSNYLNIFEVTVDGEVTVYKDKTIGEVFGFANGGTLKLLSDVDMDDVDLMIEGGTNTTLDLNGHKITTTSAYPFDIYDATLTVKDTSAEQSGGITSNNEYVFYLNRENSELIVESGEFTSREYVVYVYDGNLEISGGEFTGKEYAVRVENGSLEISGGKFIGEYYAVYVYDGSAKISGGKFIGSLYSETEGELSIIGGIFSEDPSEYVDEINYIAIYNVIDNTWIVKEAGYKNKESGFGKIEYIPV